MRAGWYERTGAAADVIQVGDMPQPEAGRGEVLVRLRASGINPSDYKRRANVKVAPEFPRVVPHSDGAGEVAAVGAGVTRFKPGDRVWCFNGQWQRAMGTAAEFIALPESRVQPLPTGTSFVEGACFGIPAMTGYHAVHVAGDPAGKTIYVPGATGRVGAYAVQFAKFAGARVIASTGGGEGAVQAIAALGADVVLDRKDPELERRLLAETDGRGVDHIVEVNLPASIQFDERVLAEGGSIVSFGAASSPTVSVTQTGRRARNMGLHFIFVYMLSEGQFAATCAGINACASAGRLRHRVGATFPLADLAKAHDFAEHTSGTGHVVVEV
jgi:NADPH2:quinone reductase